MSPVSPSERIEALDVLRGAALFGIIAANMRAFNAPQVAYIDHALLWSGTADRIAQGLIDLLITGKFITLFSFLFGIGFAVQMDRAAARGVAPRSFYLRRLGVLLLIGLAHMLLLWWGDILSAYAVVGFFLFLLRNRSQRSLLIWAAALYAWPLIVAGAAVAASLAGAHLPHPPAATDAELRRIIAVFAHGTYAQMFRERLHECTINVMGVFFFYPRALGIFLFGAWTWRTGIVRNPAAHTPLLKRLRKWGLVAGLAGNAGCLFLVEIFHPNPMAPSPAGWARLVLESLAVPLLSLFYATALVLLCQRPWRARLRPFAAVGRTALSNYLLQTVICTAIYDSWGLGWYGRVGPLLGLAPTFLIYGAQLPASLWWTRRFAYGPMEWVWRRLTYGRVPPAALPATGGA